MFEICRFKSRPMTEVQVRCSHDLSNEAISSIAENILDEHFSYINLEVEQYHAHNLVSVEIIGSLENDGRLFVKLLEESLEKAARRKSERKDEIAKACETFYQPPNREIPPDGLRIVGRIEQVPAQGAWKDDMQGEVKNLVQVTSMVVPAREMPSDEEAMLDKAYTDLGNAPSTTYGLRFRSYPYAGASMISNAALYGAKDALTKFIKAYTADDFNYDIRDIRVALSCLDHATARPLSEDVFVGIQERLTPVKND